MEPTNENCERVFNSIKTNFSYVLRVSVTEEMSSSICSDIAKYYSSGCNKELLNKELFYKITILIRQILQTVKKLINDEDFNSFNSSFIKFNKLIYFYKSLSVLTNQIGESFPQMNPEQFTPAIELLTEKGTVMEREKSERKYLRNFNFDYYNHLLESSKTFDIFQREILNSELEINLRKYIDFISHIRSNPSYDPELSDLKIAYKFINEFSEHFAEILIKHCPLQFTRSINDAQMESATSPECITLHLLLNQTNNLRQFLGSRIWYKQRNIKPDLETDKQKTFLKDVNNLDLGDNFYDDWKTIIVDPKLRYDVYLSFVDGLNNFIDLFTSLVSESNNDLLMFGIHSANIERFYLNVEDAIINAVSDDSDAMIISDVSDDEAAGVPQFVQIPGSRPGVVGFNPAYNSQSSSSPILQQVTSQSTSSASSMVGKGQHGGADGAFCEGNLDESTVPIERLGYSTLCISKTKDELKHDFTFPKTTMDDLLFTYDKTIDTLTTLLNTQAGGSIEIQKILAFIELLKSYSVGTDSEWNYYTTVLKTLDKECNKLDELTTIKVATLEKYPYLDTDYARANGYIINLNSREYFYTAIDNTTVEPIFDFKDVCTSVKDNSTADYKLYPLIEGISSVTIKDFSDSLFDFYYGPGMIDPKTTGPYPVTNFTANNKIEQITMFPNGVTNSDSTPITSLPAYKELLARIQLEQDINQVSPIGDFSRLYMTKGVNEFMLYFGVDKGFVIEGQDAEGKSNIGFIPIIKTDGITTHYNGIKFNLSSIESIEEILIELGVGDTTIDNVTNFVNEMRGVIPLNLPPNTNPSWVRLHNFGLGILKRMNETIRSEIIRQVGDDGSKLLTEIIVTLKSFGDSFQVYYSKKLRDYIKRYYNLDLYLSSTDKNVGGECMLLNNTFWLIGTGIRPHSDFFTKNMGFFGKESFKLKAKGLGIVENETEMDGTIAITTNKSLINNDKYIENINNTILKIAINLSYVPDENGSWNDIYPGNPSFSGFDQNEVITKLDVVKILLYTQNTQINATGKRQILEILGLIITDSENVMLHLKQLDAFLKKIYDVIKLMEPIPIATEVEASEAIPQAIPEATVVGVEIEKKRNLLFRKLDSLKSFIDTKFCLSLRAIKKSKILQEQSKIQAVITDAMAKTPINNIFDPNLIDFSEKYLEPFYTTSLQECSSEYDKVMEKAKEDIERTLQVLNTPDAITIARPARQAVVNAKEESIKRSIDDEIYNAELRNKGGNKIQKINEKLEDAKRNLANLIEFYGPKTLNTTERKKLESAKNLVVKSLQKVTATQQHQEANIISEATQKAKEKMDKNDPIKVTQLVTGMLSSMSSHFNKINIFKRQGGNKKRNTRKKLNRRHNKTRNIKNKKTNKQKNKKTNKQKNKAKSKTRYSKK